MPGFGSGPFGGGPGGFGEYDWSRASLYFAAPEPYRLEDDRADQLFLKYSQGQGLIFDILRRKIREFGDLRDPLRVRTKFNETQIIRLGRRVDPQEPIEQSGIEGRVEASTVFSAVRARFKPQDVGKLLIIENSKVLGNNRTVKIAVAIDTNSVATEPPLAVDTGPLRWSMRAESDEEDVTFEIDAGDVESVNPSWILTDGFVELEITGRRQFLLDETHTQQTDQEGQDGTISAGVFSAPSASFSQADVGKRFTITGSATPENNVKTEISEVLSATTIVLSATLADEQFPLTWALLKRARITLGSSAALAGFIEQSAATATVTAPNVFNAPNARFSANDVGKLITLRADGDPNNGTYEVASFVSSSQVILDATLAAGGPYFWQIRQQTGLDDPTTIQVFAPGLLDYLAQDFGVTIDTREPEEFQRRWVASVPRWMNQKGMEETYQYLARLTGFEISLTPLYRVSQSIYEDSPTLTVLLVGESGAGRSGTANGALTLVGSLVRFSSPTALFVASDVGKQVEVTGSGFSNDGVRTIVTVISATEVEFRMADTMNGASDTGLDWRIVRLYALEAPGLPVMDEINVDLMTYLKTPIPLAGRTGGDGSLVSTNRLTTPTGAFVDGEVIYQVLITGTGSGNDGYYDVDVVVSSTEIQLAGTLTTPDANNGAITWQLVEFPFTLDKYCFEENWSTEIGNGDGYLEVTAVSPGTPSPFPILYTVTVIGDVDVVTGLGVGQWQFTDSAATTFFLEDVPTESVESSGANGSILAGTPIIFNAPGAFVAGDVNKKIRVTNSISGNDGLYSIAAYIDPDNVELRGDDTPNAPDGNNGSLGWAITVFEIQTTATVPPAIGLASIEYICPTGEDCGFCGSNKILVEGSTTLLLEQPFERLFDRLEEGRPKHVEFVSKVGQTAGGTVVITGGGSTP
jgi:hypothetical protein